MGLTSPVATDDDDGIIVIEGALYLLPTLDELRWARRWAPHLLRRHYGTWWLLA
jgi:hypothetical protein